MLRQILPRVTKPGRYIGGEVHAVHKDPTKVALRVALAFPDVYEVAFSHLGLKILYHILNRRPDVWAERVYAPWPDMEAELRRVGLPLYTLESKTPLSGVDMLGITLQQELCTTNVLQLLDLGGLPLRAAQRGETDPLVVGGGPLTANPEPLAPFFDALLLGDGEQAIEEIADWLIVAKQQGLPRAERVAGLARINGVYVPALYGSRAQSGHIVCAPNSPAAPGQVRKAVVADLNAVAYIDRPLSPMVEPVHDRVSVEIQRGCSRGCRFCQAGMIYRPVRQRAPEVVRELGRCGLAASGQETLGLLSLSASDYDPLTPLVGALFSDQAGRHISVQLPSLRVEGLSDELVTILNQEKKTGFTLAPEAATERLRRVINKGNSEADLLKALETIFEKGWTHVKLYFMIGLPSETDEDVQAIIDLAYKARRVGRFIDKRASLTVSVSTFVPKAQTPFQWAAMMPKAEIERKQRLLKEGLRRVKVAFKWHHSDLSVLESAIARGDRRMADVIETAYRAGARFDAWTDFLDAALWERCFAECGLERDAYIHRDFTPGAPLPWSHLSFGVDEKFLIQEWRQAQAEALRPDCAYDRCFSCGVCDHRIIDRKVYALSDSPRAGVAHVQPTEAPRAARPAAAVVMPLQVVRFQFTKTGWAVFLGHLDVMTQVSRAFKRARITVKHSEGFSPKPRIGFSPALPLGVASLVEYFDAEILDAAPAASLMERLNRELPEGLRIADARRITPQTASVSESIAGFYYRFRLGALRSSGEIAAALERFNAAERVCVIRQQKSGERHIDLKGFVSDLHQEAQGWVRVHLRIIEQGRSVKPAEVLAAVFGVQADDLHSVEIEKSGVRFAPPSRITPIASSDTGNQQKTKFNRNRIKEPPHGSETHRQRHPARDAGGVDRERRDSRIVHRKET